MLFVADRVPESLKRVVEFLNSQMRLTEVLALELPQFVGKDVQTLVPRVFGMTADARTRRRASGSGGQGSGEYWTEQEFMLHLKTEHGEAVATTALSLLNAARESGATIYPTATALIPTWPRVEKPDVQAGFDWVFPYHIKDYGSIVIYFTSLKKRAPFDQDAKRLELIEKLNKIPGVHIPPDALNGKPAFQISTLAQGECLEKFVAVMDWVRKQTHQ